MILKIHVKVFFFFFKSHDGLGMNIIISYVSDYTVDVGPEKMKC